MSRLRWRGVSRNLLFVKWNPKAGRGEAIQAVDLADESVGGWRTSCNQGRNPVVIGGIVRKNEGRGTFVPKIYRN